VNERGTRARADDPPSAVHPDVVRPRRLETYHVTTTGSANAVLVYRFPKNHDVQTLIYALMASGSYKEQTTTKLMRWSDAAMSLRAARNLYNRGGVSCKIN
jgi:hypothetical protein